MSYSREKVIHRLVVEYCRYKHQKYIKFLRTDFSSGARMSLNQAVAHKRLQGARAWPDLQIAVPKKGYHGFFLKLKVEGTTIFKKDGTLTKNGHIAEQYAILNDLASQGYYADFGLGWEDTIKKLDWYLKDQPKFLKGKEKKAVWLEQF